MLAKIPKFRIMDLNGFLPVNKPAGICCNRLLFGLKSDLFFIMSQSGMPVSRLEVAYARHLEPFAEGLLTFVIGWGNQRRRNFIHANYKYRATIELGVERKDDCVDGDIKGMASTDHINKGLIQSTLHQFLGVTQQQRSLFVKKQKPNKSCDIMTSIDMYNLFDLCQEPKPPKPYQKYPKAEQPMDVDCKSIEMVDYCKPYLDIEIMCQGSFSMRSFCRDFSEKLGTKASVVKMTRLMEGPMWLEDLRVAHLHELNVEYYYIRLPALQDPYREYIPQFDDLFENKYYRVL